MEEHGNMKDILNEIITDNFHNQKEIIYYNEASVQLKIGFELFKRLKTEPVLEYRIKETNEYLDIFIEYDNKKYGIELKYKTKKINEYDFKNQGAQNNGKFDFIKDISRIEKFIEVEEIDAGFAILITNDDLYCKPARLGTKVKAFDLIDKETDNKKILQKGSYKAEWKGRKQQELCLKSVRQINWSCKSTEETDCAYFQHCIVEI